MKNVYKTKNIATELEEQKICLMNESGTKYISRWIAPKTLVFSIQIGSDKAENKEIKQLVMSQTDAEVFIKVLSGTIERHKQSKK